MSEPTWITYKFDALKGDESSECIQLLSQVMHSYKDLTDQERNAIAVWFVQRYNKHEREPNE